MRKLLLASAAAALLVGGAAVAAETVTTMTITPAHRTVIKNFVIREHIRPVQIKESVVVGATLPADVVLQPVPESLYTEVPEVQPYEYVDWDGKVVLVEPQTRKVVEIVE